MPCERGSRKNSPRFHLAAKLPRDIDPVRAGLQASFYIPIPLPTTLMPPLVVLTSTAATALTVLCTDLHARAILAQHLPLVARSMALLILIPIPRGTFARTSQRKEATQATEEGEREGAFTGEEVAVGGEAGGDDGAARLDVLPDLGGCDFLCWECGYG